MNNGGLLLLMWRHAVAWAYIDQVYVIASEEGGEGGCGGSQTTSQAHTEYGGWDTVARLVYTEGVLIVHSVCLQWL